MKLGKRSLSVGRRQELSEGKMWISPRYDGFSVEFGPIFEGNTDSFTAFDNDLLDARVCSDLSTATVGRPMRWRG